MQKITRCLIIFLLAVTLSCMVGLTAERCAAGQAPQRIAQAGAVAGTYSCESFNVGGRGGKPASMPWLYLLDNGTYKYGSAQGSYTYSDGVLRLTGANKSWGPGRVDKDRKIWFQFTTPSGYACTMTFYRRGSLQDYPPR